MGRYIPPFGITDRTVDLVAEIAGETVRIGIQSQGGLGHRLRKKNRIRSINSSLAIEGNTLSLEQVTAVIEGKRILGNPVEIKEVRNAYTTYSHMLDLDPFSVDDLLKAHKMMMDGLIPENGAFRSGGVGVFSGKTLVHMAPPAEFVPGEIKDLFEWYRDSSMHPLIKSAVFHYEFEFIHPFADGNGRLGRMWHSILLGKWNELFYWLPVEELIHSRQKEYYDAIGRSTEETDCAPFVELMLDIILDTLRNTDVVGTTDEGPDPYVRMLLNVLKNEEFSSTELMSRLGLSHKPSFRKNYLVPALERGFIEMTIPDRPNDRNQKYRKL